jgi:hypothetical protein
VSLKELEKQVQLLPKAELMKFSEWFDLFRDAHLLVEDSASDIEAAHKEEVLRRQAEYLSDPSLATSWDDGFFDRLRQQMADVRAQKTASR